MSPTQPAPAPERTDDAAALAATLSAGRAPEQGEYLRRALECTLALPQQDEAGGRRGHALGAARIVHELGLDHEAVAAALLHPCFAAGRLDASALEKRFGASLRRLLGGVVSMDALPAGASLESARAGRRASAENLRKMLIAMVDDVRVVLIRLAEQLQSLRELKGVDAEARLGAARETLDLFAPLANRLGVWQLKWELEDLSLRYLKPDAYRQIAARLAERRVDRERYIEELIVALERGLAGAGVRAEVSGRPKHIYSIWKKMRRKDVDFDRISDVRGVRVLVPDVPSCYAALGAVHGLWSPIRGEFDDYIATPKQNNYQSIHTAVVGPQGRVVEVQIRTHAMHEENELGVAAHWRYKEQAKAKAEAGLDRKILWLRQLLEWKEEVSEAADLAEAFRSDAFEDRVYVFTPLGNVVDLPQGSTALDFAYAIHTEVGHRCRGAKADGRIVALTRPLATGEQVEILTVKKGGPSRDWLNPHLGYLTTSRARARVQRWFKAADFDQNLAAGRAALDRELHRLGVGDVKFDKLAAQLGYRRSEDFLAAIGSGDLKISQAVASLRERIVPPREVPETLPASRGDLRAGASRALEILGVGNLLTRMASCCSPLPGDPVVGYITQGRGVSIHRRDCANVLRFADARHDRLVEVEWGSGDGAEYPVDIEVTAYDRHGLLRDITGVFADAKINIAAVHMQTSRSDNVARVTLTAAVGDVDKLSALLARVARIGNVTEVRRLSR